MKSYQRACLLLAVEAVRAIDAGTAVLPNASFLRDKWVREAALLLASLGGIGGVW